MDIVVIIKSKEASNLYERTDNGIHHIANTNTFR